jgi:hypothetical protein
LLHTVKQIPAVPSHCLRGGYLIGGDISANPENAKNNHHSQLRLGAQAVTIPLSAEELLAGFSADTFVDGYSESANP